MLLKSFHRWLAGDAIVCTQVPAPSGKVHVTETHTFTVRQPPQDTGQQSCQLYQVATFPTLGWSLCESFLKPITSDRRCMVTAPLQRRVFRWPTIASLFLHEAPAAGFRIGMVSADVACSAVDGAIQVNSDAGAGHEPQHHGVCQLVQLLESEEAVRNKSCAPRPSSHGCSQLARHDSQQGDIPCFSRVCHKVGWGCDTAKTFCWGNLMASLLQQALLGSGRPDVLLMSLKSCTS